MVLSIWITIFWKEPAWFVLEMSLFIDIVPMLTKLMALLFRRIKNGKLMEWKSGTGIRSVHWVSSPSGQSILIRVRRCLSTMPTQGTPQQPTANLLGDTSCTYVTRWSERKKSFCLMNFFYRQSYEAKKRPPEQAST